MRSPVIVVEKMTATGFDVTVHVPLSMDAVLAANAQFGPLDLDKVMAAMADSDRDNFERERLISLIIDVGMMRRDVATDVADAVLKRWTLQRGVETAVWEQAYQIDARNLREKMEKVHRLMCEANARLDDADVEAAWDKIRLAIRLAT